MLFLLCVVRGLGPLISACVLLSLSPWGADWVRLAHQRHLVLVDLCEPVSLGFGAAQI